MTAKKKSGEGTRATGSVRARVRGTKKPNPDREMFKPEQVIEAIQEADGFMTYAAKYMGYNRKTISDYIKKYPDIREAHKQANEVLGDEIAHNLMRLARKKKHRDHFNALKLIAQTKFKGRGYGSSLDISHEFEVPEGFDINVVNAPRKKDAKT